MGIGVYLKRKIRGGLRFVFGLQSCPLAPGFTKADTKNLNRCGERVWIQEPITIEGAECVSLGTDVSFAAYVHIWGSGGVTIGNRVMIGTHTSITSLTHDYTKKEMYKSLVKRPVIIHDDVWIGSNCVILPGIEIGEGSVIGAGSVVTRHVEPYSIVVGNPARKIKTRLIDL